MLNTKGRIFDIQRFSVHDGPGIRTIVFLKGCFLRCAWCCNPESQEYKIETMLQEGKQKIIGKDVTVKEVLDEIEKDRIYFWRSGGGITLSGGEATAQPEFACALLACAKERGINTCIETTGFAEWSVIESILPYLDTILLDIKHINSEKHRQFTSQPNERILENAKKMVEAGANVIVRVPVIPTFNATAEEIEAIAEFAKSIGIKKLHLLPYHNFGADKYTALAREYTLKHITTLANEEMLNFKATVEKKGIYCQIGG